MFKRLLVLSIFVLSIAVLYQNCGTGFMSVDGKSQSGSAGGGGASGGTFTYSVTGDMTANFSGACLTWRQSEPTNGQIQLLGMSADIRVQIVLAHDGQSTGDYFYPPANILVPKFPIVSVGVENVVCRPGGCYMAEAGGTPSGPYYCKVTVDSHTSSVVSGRFDCSELSFTDPELLILNDRSKMVSVRGTFSCPWVPH